MSIVKSLSVGHGDMFYITHNTDNFTIIDCSMSEDNKSQIVGELKEQSAGKKIKRFISTHPDDDHICHLTYLHEQMNLVNFYCVANEATKPDYTDDFNLYCELRDDPKRAFHIFKRCSRRWMNLEGEGRRSSGINILWPDASNQSYKDALAVANEGGSPNNISAIVKYSLVEGAAILWMGDLDTGFMEDLHPVIPVERADILFAPHHGRDSGKVPATWLEKIKPKLIVIGEAPSEHLNYYYGYNTITQNSAGDITFECESGKTHIFVSEEGYFVDFLVDEGKTNEHGWYIGTLMV